MKKKLSFILSLVLIFTLCMGSVSFANAGTKEDSNFNTVEGIYWQFIPSTGTLMIYGEGAMGDYEFADAYRAYVYKNAVCYPWQSHANEIRKVKICDGITHVGNWAFARLKKIEEVEIANTVVDIGEGAFAYCTGIKEVSLPDSVKELKFQAFKSCINLKKFDLNKVEIIGPQVFDNTPNLGMVVPSSVKKMSAEIPFGSKSYVKFESSTPPELTEKDAWLVIADMTVNYLVPKGSDKNAWMNMIKSTYEWDRWVTWNIIEYDDTAAKDLAAEVELKVSSSKLIKGTKVSAKVSSGDLQAIKDLGYDVTFKYYRSTKKNSGYVLMKESKSQTYKNTSGKKGTKYYYKVKIEVADVCGDVIYSGNLKEQKPCYRTFK